MSINYKSNGTTKSLVETKDLAWANRVNLTTSYGTGDFRLYKIGKIGFLVLSIFLAQDIAKNTTVVLADIPEGYRPGIYQTFREAAGRGSITLTTDNKISFRDANSTWNAGSALNCCTTYVIK